MSLALGLPGVAAPQERPAEARAAAAVFPYRYSGWLGREGQPPLAALTRGRDTLLVAPGDTIEAVYRLEEIDPRRIVVTYLPLQQRQTIELASPAVTPPKVEAAPAPPAAPTPSRTPLGAPGPACC